MQRLVWVYTFYLTIRLILLITVPVTLLQKAVRLMAHPSDKVVSEYEPTKSPRECRDIVFLLLFFAFMIGMGLVAWRAVRYGNPARIIYGEDSWGNVCNQQNAIIDGVKPERTGLDMHNKQYLYFFKEDIVSLVATGDMESARICVSKCPGPTTLGTVAEMQAFTNSTGSHLCAYDVSLSGYFDGNSNGLDNCPPLPIQPHEAFLHRCVPNSLTKRIDHVLNAVNSLFNVIDENFLEKCASDVMNTWGEIVFLCCLAFIVALIATLLIQFFASIIVWTMVIGVVIGSIVATGVCWYHYYNNKTNYAETPVEDRTVEMENSVSDWLIGSIVVSVVTVIVILILLAVRQHIALVVQLFREAGKAIRKMPLLLFQPVITIIFLCGPILAMGFVFLYIETAGVFSKQCRPSHQIRQLLKEISDQELHCVARVYPICHGEKYMKWYHIFGMIWIAQFVMACHKLTIAGAVSSWYFTRDKNTLSVPILKSIARLVRYHLGSLAFGSLILSIVYFIRMVLTFIENRLRGRTHPVATFLLKCLTCCIWCFEKFLKFLNSNAYIQIAIHGYGFCKAARQAFLVIVNNALRVVAINSVGDFVLFLGKVGTIAIVCVTGIEMTSVRKDVNYVWLPVVLVAIFAYFISTSFMSVYEMTIDTIFQCFCEDSLMNDGQSKPYYMSTGLMRCMSAQLQKRKKSIKVKPSEQSGNSAADEPSIPNSDLKKP